MSYLVKKDIMVIYQLLLILYLVYLVIIVYVIKGFFFVDVIYLILKYVIYYNVCLLFL